MNYIENAKHTIKLDLKLYSDKITKIQIHKKQKLFNNRHTFDLYDFQNEYFSQRSAFLDNIINSEESSIPPLTERENNMIKLIQSISSVSSECNLSLISHQIIRIKEHHTSLIIYHVICLCHSFKPSDVPFNELNQHYAWRFS